MNGLKFVCGKPINKRMLIYIAYGNGSFKYRIELSKTREAEIMLNENMLCMHRKTPDKLKNPQ